jgi:tripartite-type tricarboxylate transporter receptor subunit TctC
MMGGRLDMMFDNLSASKQYVQTGRLKGLAVSSASRSPQLANVPTVNETGLAKFEGESWFGPFAPARTPVRVVETLRTVFAGIVRDPEFVARVERDGGRELAIPAGGQRRFLQEEIERWGEARRAVRGYCRVGPGGKSDERP